MLHIRIYHRFDFLFTITVAFYFGEKEPQKLVGIHHYSQAGTFMWPREKGVTISHAKEIDRTRYNERLHILFLKDTVLLIPELSSPVQLLTRVTGLQHPSHASCTSAHCSELFRKHKHFLFMLYLRLWTLPLKSPSSPCDCWSDQDDSLDSNLFPFVFFSSSMQLMIFSLTPPGVVFF